MKIVACQKCGAKYQLNDNEDENSYECNICTGNLKEVNTEPSKQNNYLKKDLQIVYCEDCGVKYRIDKTDNIDEYECNSCGGKLKYTDKEKQEETEQKQTEHTAKIVKKENLNELKEELEEFKKDIENYNPNLDSENKEIKEDEIKNRYELALYRYYGELKREMKKEYIKHIYEIPYEGNMINQLSNRFKDKITSTHISKTYPGSIQENDNGNIKEKSNYFNSLTIKEASIILGTLITIIGLISIIMVNILYSIIILIIGIITLVYGFKGENSEDIEEEKEDNIHSKLLTLPEEYYILYMVKTPGLQKSIDYVIIGPSGTFTITKNIKNTEKIKNSNKENIKNKLKNFKNKYNINPINSNNNEDQDDIEFKQLTLDLNRKLFEFLDEHEITMAVEPLAGFVNDKITIINVILDDEDLFIDELIYKIVNSEKRLDDVIIKKTAVILSQYSLN